jgi:hypothetical protein
MDEVPRMKMTNLPAWRKPVIFLDPGENRDDGVGGTA